MGNRWSGTMGRKRENIYNGLNNKDVFKKSKHSLALTAKSYLPQFLFPGTSYLTFNKKRPDERQTSQPEETKPLSESD